MKTNLLFLICWAIAGLFHTLPAQNTSKCYDYACMMQKARMYIQEKNFEAALNSITAAKRYSDANEVEADALIKVIFKEINQLRLQAEAGTEIAQKATLAAENAAKIAADERNKSRRAEADARLQRDSVIAARALVEELIRKGEALQNTFSDVDSYDLLYQTGLQYFQWNKTEQSRDYKNALTYFVVARLLKASDTLDHLVFAAKTGIEAEVDFYNGDLESARKKYSLVQSNVNSASHNSDFEAWRLQQIQEVDSLYLQFRQKHDTNTTTPDTLFGNWWTIPSDFQQFQAITNLVFKNNTATFRQFPRVLNKLPGLALLAIINCPEIRKLENWSDLRHLQALVLKDNANLYSLGNLEKTEELIFLNIDNCPALTLIEGCKQLESLAIKKSPQVRIATLLLENTSLKKLELADLPDGSFNSENLQALESLSLARMEASHLLGLDKNSFLRTLKIDQLDQLQRFTPPSQLTTAYISHCNSLIGLDNWPQSDSLDKFVLYKNYNLKALPDWKRFPNLKHLLIQNNETLTEHKNFNSLKKTERLFILNNPSLITNSINGGYGSEWGVDMSSVKLEFEHRQIIRWLKSDIGFKFLGAYVQKIFVENDLYKNREMKSFLAGFLVNYYTPFRVYLGFGIGVGRTRSLLADQSLQHKINFLWINQLGYQVAPYFLKKDKISINMDFYSIFEEGDYFILPSFGLTYYHTLDFNRKTYFIRPGDSRRHIVPKWRVVRENNKQRIDTLPEQF